MQIIVSIFLDLWEVNTQNIRSVAFIQGEITSEFYLMENNFLREVSNLLTNKMKFLIKNSDLIFFFLIKKEWILKKEFPTLISLLRLYLFRV